MAPLPLPDIDLDEIETEVLLEIADAEIVAGLRGHVPTAPDPLDLPEMLRAPVGSFVTLTVRSELNGCVGSIEGFEPLGLSVARHAWSAAFADPRLPALRAVDYAHLTIEVSILSPLAEIAADSRREMLDALRPDVDGLVIAAGRQRAVFLPAVWDAVADPVEFLDRLYMKAGLRPGSWPQDIQAFRFTADKIRRDQRSRNSAVTV
jgi:AmmeMemoRadiSam system protein A